MAVSFSIEILNTNDLDSWLIHTLTFLFLNAGIHF
jgi:hypothetical protein